MTIHGMAMGMPVTMIDAMVGIVPETAPVLAMMASSVHPMAIVTCMPMSMGVSHGTI